MHEHEQDTTDVLRGPKVNAKRNWDVDILPRLKPWDSLDSCSIIQPYRLKYSHSVQDLC